MAAPSRRIIAAAAAAVVVFLAWMFWWRSDERAIRRELANLAADANAPAGDGLGTVSWAAQLGTYFTEDVVVAITPETTPMTGRHSIVGMATRFRPRFAAHTVALDDVTVQQRAERGIADVRVTMTLTPSAGGSREPIDARELALEMKKDGGRWRISRVTGVDVLR